MEIIREPKNVYPSFNDSFVVMRSEAERIEIQVLPVDKFPKIFFLYPSPDLKECQFNLVDVVKVFYKKGFNDFNFFDEGFSKSISGNFLKLNVLITEVDGLKRKTIEKEYNFYKSVKQVGEQVFSNPYRVLSSSGNGVDFYLTYFEGFPFSFDLMRVKKDDILTLINKKTGVSSLEMKPISTGAFRINIDNSNGDNFTSKNFLPLLSGVNKLELLKDGEFKSNIFIKKKKVCSGVLLKWWNSEGGFSHYLFDGFYKEVIKSKNIALISDNDYRNIDDMGANVRSVGKVSVNVFKLKVRCDEKESEILRSLFVSPYVEMYSSQKANVKGVFIGVQINDSFEYSNKKGFNSFSLVVRKPDLITAKL